MLAGGLRSALSELPSVTLWDLGGVEGEPGVEASQCGLVTFSVLDRTIMLRCCPVAFPHAHHRFRSCAGGRNRRSGDYQAADGSR
jgi:hypothetical protein